jgi:hypothetical protein
LNASFEVAYRRFNLGLVTQMLKDDEGEQLWAFDLDALRKAFDKYVEEHKTTAAEWGEHAKRFLQKQRARQRDVS